MVCAEPARDIFSNTRGLPANNYLFFAIQPTVYPNGVACLFISRRDFVPLSSQRVIGGYLDIIYQREKDHPTNTLGDGNAYLEF